ncbi:hypothetical protein COCNU_scaffold069186G000010 [Cocos nucifera]|nr:hypothetical protein [Cocos nucifera]
MVKSSVKGIEIILDPVHFGKILYLPCEGYKEMKLTHKKEGLRAILGRKFEENLNKLEAKILSMEMRLLNHMVTKLFISRSGRHDLLSSRDICIMYHMITEIPLNLYVLKIEAMRETLNRSKAHLPYGMTLILVFRGFGVSFEGEAITKLSYTDIINRHTLHHMDFSKIDGSYSKDIEEEERAEEEGPSSPPRDHRASIDIQFVSDHEASPLVSMRRDALVSPSESRDTAIRFIHDQLRTIANFVSQQIIDRIS